MMTLNAHQSEAVAKGLPILTNHKVVYLVMEVRTGKTLTALALANQHGSKSVAFITRKKAIPSIESDFDKSGFGFDLTVTNYESIHKLDAPSIELYILDEAHCLGAFPKMSLRAKELKDIIKGKPCILLSGTPTPESYSQIFHQLLVTGNSPFDHKTFYNWASEYVNVWKRIINGFNINDYSRAKVDLIMSKCEHLMVKCTQEQAGFHCEVTDEIVSVPSNEISKFLYKTLEKDLVAEWGGKTFVADNPAILINKLSQISGGTLIGEDDQEAISFDDSKANYIKQNFSGKRLAIYYRYKGELKILQQTFLNHTMDWVEFEKRSFDIFLCQIQSGREGISLRSADLQIMYNIDFSATSYWQVRARMQHRDRIDPVKVIWLFSDLGIEKLIMKAVTNKKNFTASYYGKQNSIKNKSEAREPRLVSGKDNESEPEWMARPTSPKRRESVVHRSETTRCEADKAPRISTRPTSSSWF